VSPLAPALAVWQTRLMAQPNARAGGVFLMIGILGGLAWGIVSGNAMQGVLIGMAIGIGVAILLWLADRNR